MNLIDLLAVNLSPYPLKNPTQFVDETLAYALPSIITFCTAAVGFKILVYFLNAGKGQ